MDLATFIELFTWPLVALGLAAVAAPLVGAFLHVRGTGFHGIALPQVAAFGVALGYALAPVLTTLATDGHGHDHGHHHGDAVDPTRTYLFAFAGAAVALSMVVLSLLRSRGQEAPGAEASRVAALFALASGGSVVASRYSPHGGMHVDALLSGDTLASGPEDGALLGAAALATVLAVKFGWRQFTAAGRDGEFMQLVGASPRMAGVVLNALTAFVVVAGSLAVGALAMFALLVIPPMSAVRASRSMARYLVLSPLVGVLGAALGAFFAFWLDWPMDAGVVAGVSLVGATLVISSRGVPAIGRALGRTRRSSAT